MKVVTEAIYDYYISDTTSALYLDMNTRFWRIEAPQNNTTFPYVVFFLVDNVYSFGFERDTEFFRVQFDIWGNKTTSAAKMEDYYEHLKSKFDWCKLTVEGYDSLYMRRVLANLTKDEEFDYWHYIIQYNLEIDKIIP